MMLFESFAISASGLTAQRLWLDVTANNIANMHTANRPSDTPAYRRRVPLFREKLGLEIDRTSAGAQKKLLGVEVATVVSDPAPARMVYEPDHPLADPESGYVAYPNINISNEMVNMIAATRAYEANVTAFNAAKDMAQKALEIGRG